jgi:hypothetical protein
VVPVIGTFIWANGVFRNRPDAPPHLAARLVALAKTQLLARLARSVAADGVGGCRAGVAPLLLLQLSDWSALLPERDDAIDIIEVDVKKRGENEPKDAVPGTLQSALTYVEHRSDRLRYASARAAKLPIGSGTVEATGKANVEVRTKRPGALWTPVGAHASMGLRALVTSFTERWDLAIAQVPQPYTTPVTPLPARAKTARRKAK